MKNAAGDCRVFLCLAGTLRLRNGNRFALLPPPREIPLIRKASALPRFDRLDRAFNPVQEDAFPIWLVDQGETSAIQSNIGVLCHEIVERFPEKLSNLADLVIGHRHFPMPSTAVSTPLPLVVDALFHVIQTHRANFVIFPGLSGVCARFSE